LTTSRARCHSHATQIDLGKTTYRLGIMLTVLGGDVLGATVSVRAR